MEHMSLHMNFLEEKVKLNKYSKKATIETEQPNLAKNNHVTY
jgi:hypothetical protein